MAGRFSNSWTLMKASTKVLMLDKELLVFPLMAGIATILIAATFIAPVVVWGGVEMLEQENTTYLGSAFGFLFRRVRESRRTMRGVWRWRCGRPERRSCTSKGSPGTS